MFCPKCGKESLSGTNFCSFCGAVSTHRRASDRPRLVRPTHPRMIAGVCSGFAIHFGWDIGLVRILFAVLTCLTTGLGVLVYLGCWIAIPEGLYSLPPGTRNVPPTPVRTPPVDQRNSAQRPTA